MFIPSFTNNQKKCLIFYLLVLFCSITVDLYSNNSKKDSLIKVLEIATDTQRVNVLNSLAFDYTIEKQLDSAQRLLGECDVLNSNLNYTSGKIRTNYLKGLICFVQNKYDEALILFDKSLQLAKEDNDSLSMVKALIKVGAVNDEKGNYTLALQNYFSAQDLANRINYMKGVIDANANIGIVYFNQGSFSKALEYYYSALKYEEAEKDSASMAKTLNNIALTHGYFKEYDKALKMHLRSLNIKTKLKDIRGIAIANNNIGKLYSEMKLFDTAEVYFLKSFAIKDSLNDKRGTASTLVNLASIALEKGDYAKGLEFGFRSVELCDETDNKLVKVAALEAIALNYSACKKFDNAEKYALESFKLSEDMGLLEEIQSLSLLLSDIYEKINKPASSLFYYKKYAQAKDSIYADEKIKSAVWSEAEYQFDKKLSVEKSEQEKRDFENRITIQQKNYWVYTFIIVMFLVTFSGVLFIRQNRLRNEQQTVLLEQKLLRSQMNPHFIFNSLGAIQSFVQKSDSEGAMTYLSKFSKLIRLVLENSRFDYVPIEKEVKTLENYLQMQQLLIDKKFEYFIEVDEKIDRENICIPPMLAQPFIENSLKHGIAGIQDVGRITINFRMEGSLILFEVIDNGIGIYKSMELKQENESTHKSLATEITRERLKNLNKRTGKKIEISVIELKDASNNVIGTKATFEIPFQYLT